MTATRSSEKVIPRGAALVRSPAPRSALRGAARVRREPIRQDERYRAPDVLYNEFRSLADDVQELALRLGRCASVRPHAFVPGDGHLGTKPRLRVTIYASRNSRPALCRVSADRDNHMGVEQYDGVIHCVEVPNRTLYVRRNGYPIWSGNTPFEHNAFRFHIRAPIFVVQGMDATPCRLVQRIFHEIRQGDERLLRARGRRRPVAGRQARRLLLRARRPGARRADARGATGRVRAGVRDVRAARRAGRRA